MSINCVKCDKELSEEAFSKNIFTKELWDLDIDFICPDCIFRLSTSDVTKIRSGKPFIVIDKIDIKNPCNLSLEKAKEAIEEGKKVSHITWWENDYVDNIVELEYWVEGFESKYQNGWKIYK